MRSAAQSNAPRTLRIVTTLALAALAWLPAYWGPAASAKMPGTAAPLETTFTIAIGAGSPDRLVNNSAVFATPAIAMNIERASWPTAMPADRIEVNTATALLQLFRNNAPIFITRVVVGGRGRPTPEFQASIESVLFNPSWYVPHSIAVAEILPKLKTDPGYLRRHNMVIRNGSVVQLPGPDNALGQVKFEMPNPYDVYLHDTPLKHLFNLDDRRQSHGCVRVQNPRQLAALLLREPIEAINSAVAPGYTRREFLPNPVPIFIFYGPIAPAAGTARQEDVPVC
jgi:murein L,D-transpeptidase YcbB/YkuD